MPGSSPESGPASGARPSLEQFLQAPLTAVRAVAPPTVILTNGGTRRRALLEGISPTSADYVKWTRQAMLRTVDLIFRHGVRHIITLALAESNYDEVTPRFREELARWADWAIAGPEALADYQAQGWQVRLIGAASWPELLPTAARLVEATPQQPQGPCLWFTVAANPETRWQELFAALQTTPIRSRAEAIRVLFGQEIPLADLLIGSGKPQLFASIAPPLLIGNLQCYWRQHLGYDLDERTLRTILYDFAYLRRTWQQDKTGRAEEALPLRRLWDAPPVVGVGMAVGPFWYPAPIAPPPLPGEAAPSPHATSC